MRMKPLGSGTLNRSFKTARTDRLQALLDKYNIQATVLDVTGGVVKLSVVEKVDEYLAKSVLKKEGFDIQII